MGNNQNPNQNQFLRDRLIERGTGCWNCKNRDSWEDGRKFWFDKRQSALAKAVLISTSSPNGENDQRVVQIRAFVHQADGAFAKNEAIHCTKGRTIRGEQVGDITPSNYMCEKWTGLDGASMAKIDGKVDTLPEELLFEEQPQTLEQFAKNTNTPSLISKKSVE